MLKHYLEYHRDADMRFGMKAVRFHESAFQRQIHESTTIQAMRTKHNILNSRAEYNRCALPRLGVRWGEREFKNKKKEDDEEKRKEEELEALIKEMRKRKKQGEKILENWNLPEPAKKRRKMNETESEDLMPNFNEKTLEKCDIRKFFDRLCDDRKKVTESDTGKEDRTT